jgi:DNA-directed RNA polymerase alpha subunit
MVGRSACVAGQEEIEDVADEFCYELALALRRILGLEVPGGVPEEEDEWADLYATAEHE